MKRITSIDKSYRCDASKAIDKFFKAYPEYKEEWEDCFRWMAESHTESFSDTMLADGSYNKMWRYSLWLIEEENITYIALVERA